VPTQTVIEQRKGDDFANALAAGDGVIFDLQRALLIDRASDACQRIEIRLSQPRRGIADDPWLDAGGFAIAKTF